VADWRAGLNGDPLPWLLERSDPGPRHLALRELLDRPIDDPEVVEARAAAMTADPIASILSAQHPDGWWVQPGHGYAPKYSGTVWNLTFLDQLGADGRDLRVRRACEYVLDWTYALGGGFGAAPLRDGRAAPSSTIHCLTGNLLRALLDFGYGDDERVRQSIAWQAAAITGEGMPRWYGSSTSGPGFACAGNTGSPCAWGAVKAVRALARVPPDRRGPAESTALHAAVEFLLSRDPAVADYPIPEYNSKPSGSWFRLGFPTGYITDVLQNLEALCEAGAATDPRLDRAFSWLLARQDTSGRWVNEKPLQGKLTTDIDEPSRPSKWITLRAGRVLKARAAQMR
jgi:hypothetical protein